jgi:hypothetical protein
VPIESIAEILGMVSRADFSENTGIPDALLLFLRVFPIPHGGSYAILESSPLLDESGPSPQTWDSARTFQEITRWTLGIVFKSIDQVQERANDLYREIYPVRCSHFLARG